MKWVEDEDERGRRARFFCRGALPDSEARDQRRFTLRI